MGPLRSVVGAPRVPHVVSASSRASLSLRARWGRALVSRRGPLCLVFVLTAFTWESVSARVVVSDHGPRYSHTSDGRDSSHRRCGSSIVHRTSPQRQFSPAACPHMLWIRTFSSSLSSRRPDLASTLHHVGHRTQLQRKMSVLYAVAASMRWHCLSASFDQSKAQLSSSYLRLVLRAFARRTFYRPSIVSRRAIARNASSIICDQRGCRAFAPWPSSHRFGLLSMGTRCAPT